ncbi:hypothetical protein G6F59_017548 [Rhizopus arrhizus]|nr:hypothetical protein G6F59_017548 [Rhizopus arrhizus]
MLPSNRPRNLAAAFSFAKNGEGQRLSGWHAPASPLPHPFLLHPVLRPVRLHSVAVFSERCVVLQQSHDVRQRRDCHDRDAVGLGHVLHRRMRRQRIVRAGAFHAVHGAQHGGRFGARAADDLNGFAHRRACRDHVVNDDDLAL